MNLWSASVPDGIIDPMQEEPQRPWTVKALVVLSVLGTVIGAVIQDQALGAVVFNIAFTALMVWAYWEGKRWAYQLTFALIVLGGTLGTLALFLNDETTLVQRIYWIATIVVYVVLLQHPRTKAFIGIGETPPPAGPPSRGGRGIQALAISVFGVLAVGVPLLWAVGVLGGAALAIGAVLCLAAGLALLYVGLPARRDHSSATSTSLRP